MTRRDEMKNIREYRSMISTKNSIEDYEREDTILDMKLKILHRFYLNI